LKNKMSTIQPFSDEYFMREALKEAKKAEIENEVPVGAVIVCNEKIIARTHNLTETLTDVTAHAEMQAITSAENAINGKFLEECILYVTLEPCVMCAGACYWSRFKRIVYGALDPKRGASLVGKNLYHPKTEIVGGVLATECGEIISEFFRKKRELKL
jgi:tRNA(adenine34) deaminase